MAHRGAIGLKMALYQRFSLAHNEPRILNNKKERFIMQVAIFEGYMKLNSYQANVGSLTVEDKIDSFLYNHPEITIHHIKQSSASIGEAECFSNITTISIWYEE